MLKLLYPLFLCVSCAPFFTKVRARLWIVLLLALFLNSLYQGGECVVYWSSFLFPQSLDLEAISVVFDYNHCLIHMVLCCMSHQ